MDNKPKVFRRNADSNVISITLYNLELEQLDRLALLNDRSRSGMIRDLVKEAHSYLSPTDKETPVVKVPNKRAKRKYYQ